MTRPSYGRFTDTTNTPTEILASTVGLEKIGIMLDNSAAAVAATLSTALTGDNNDLTFTAVVPGAAGNQLEVAYVDPSGNNQTLAVTVADGVISVSLATGAGGAITSTANDILAAVNADATAGTLVTASLKTGNTGAGVVTAMSATNLSGGSNASTLTSLVKGTIMAKVTATGLYTAYNDGNSPAGVGTALGILSDDFNLAYDDQNDVRLTANMYIHGSFVEANLTGLDANAKTDLLGRTVGTVFTF